MISRTTLRPLLSCIKFGDTIKSLPFGWDSCTQRAISNRYKLTKSGKYKKKHILLDFWLHFYIYHAIVEIIFNSTIVWVVSSHVVAGDTSAPDIIASIFWIILSGITCCIRYVYLIRGEELKFQLNGLLFINENSYKYLDIKLDPLEKDGLEFFSQILPLFAAGTIVIAYFGSIIAIEINLPGFRYLNFGSTSITIMSITVILFEYIYAWTAILVFVYMILFAVHSTTIWQEKLLKQMGSAKILILDRLKEKIHIYYRIQQVQQVLTSESLTIMHHILLPIVQLMMIISVFSIIRYHIKFHPLFSLLLICVGLFTSLIMKLGIEMAVIVTENSEKISKIGLSCGWVRTLDKKRYNSYRTFKWKIGSLFVLTKTTFIIIIHSIVVSSVVNLLVIIQH